MRSRALGLVAITLTSLLGLADTVGIAQSQQQPAARATTPAKGRVPRTPWGDPDLQGVWDYRTITPLERNRELGTREFYTEEEKKTLEARAGRRRAREGATRYFTIDSFRCGGCNRHGRRTSGLPLC